MRREWSEEEMQNAMTYGICLICHTPLHVEMTDEVVDGKRIVDRHLTCPNWKNHDE